ncbi:hypothetical protein [Candidatus Binatus sp.]|uniref:hypothetical protein n=1 Tax=Candidatus Binatus sp. TaxID=2811406 RepID=UPI003C724039
MDAKAVAAVLRSTLANKGWSVANDPGQIESVLRSQSPATADEITALAAASRAGVPAFLMQLAPGGLNASAVNARVNKMGTDFGLSPELARWSIVAWAMALGVLPVPSGSGPGSPGAANAMAERTQAAIPKRQSGTAGGIDYWRFLRTGLLVVSCTVAGALFLNYVTGLGPIEKPGSNSGVAGVANEGSTGSAQAPASSTSARAPVAPPGHEVNVEDVNPKGRGVSEGDAAGGPASDATASTVPDGGAGTSARVPQFKDASFKRRTWMRALYDENFPLLNKDRLDVLAYLYGVHSVLFDKDSSYHDACSAKVNQKAAFTTAYVWETGSEPKEGLNSLESVQDWAKHFLIDPSRDPAGWTVGENARGRLQLDGESDATLLLRDYGSCSSAVFMKFYSGVTRFIFNDAPVYRASNATPSLLLKIDGPFVDYFNTKETGQQYFRFRVGVVNYDILPKDIFPLSPPRDDLETSPIRVELIAGDGKSIGKWEDPWKPDVLPWPPQHLKDGFSFSSLKGHFPEKVYLVLYDVKHDKVYRSDSVAIASATPPH